MLWLIVIQIIGKPSQAIPLTPVQSILDIDESFEHVFVDCVASLL